MPWSHLVSRLQLSINAFKLLSFCCLNPLPHLHNSILLLRVYGLHTLVLRDSLNICFWFFLYIKSLCKSCKYNKLSCVGSLDMILYMHIPLTCQVDIKKKTSSYGNWMNYVFFYLLELGGQKWKTLTRSLLRVNNIWIENEPNILLQNKENYTHIQITFFFYLGEKFHIN